jgi:predicted AlkP superfamily phosphohydrolase/phosphomutase
VGNGGQIFINLRGREPQGIVEPGAEYECVVDRIIDRLSEMADPSTGEPIELDVYRRDELYAGEHVDLLPDVVFLPRDLKRMPFGEYEFGSNKLVGPSWSISGTHRMNGIVGLWGPGVRAGYKLRNAQIVDLAPTILALLDVEIPNTMDGRVLSEAFEEGALSPRWSAQDEILPQSEQVLLTEDEEAEIAARLRGLGYVG